MSGFLYYLPDARGQVDNDLLSRFGLAHIRENDDPLHSRQVIRGPGDTPGLIVGNVINWDSAEVKQSESIEWKRFPKSHAESQAYLGWLKSEPLPKPDVLARKVQLAGEWLTLADGNRWLVPIARKVTDDGLQCALPLAFELDDDTGQWVPTKVLREYQAIWDHAIAYNAAMLAALEGRKEGEPISFTIPDAEQLVVDALAVNYRVS